MVEGMSGFGNFAQAGAGLLNQLAMMNLSDEDIEQGIRSANIGAIMTSMGKTGEDVDIRDITVGLAESLGRWKVHTMFGGVSEGTRLDPQGVVQTLEDILHFSDALPASFDAATVAQRIFNEEGRLAIDDWNEYYEMIQKVFGEVESKVDQTIQGGLSTALNLKAQGEDYGEELGQALTEGMQNAFIKGLTGWLWADFEDSDLVKNFKEQLNLAIQGDPEAMEKARGYLNNIKQWITDTTEGSSELLAEWEQFVDEVVAAGEALDGLESTLKGTIEAAISSEDFGEYIKDNLENALKKDLGGILAGWLSDEIMESSPAWKQLKDTISAAFDPANAPFKESLLYTATEEILPQLITDIETAAEDMLPLIAAFRSLNEEVANLEAPLNIAKQGIQAMLGMIFEDTTEDERRIEREINIGIEKIKMLDQQILRAERLGDEAQAAELRMERTAEVGANAAREAALDAFDPEEAFLKAIREGLKSAIIEGITSAMVEKAMLETALKPVMDVIGEWKPGMSGQELAAWQADYQAAINQSGMAIAGIQKDVLPGLIQIGEGIVGGIDFIGSDAASNVHDAITGEGGDVTDVVGSTMSGSSPNMSVTASIPGTGVMRPLPAIIGPGSNMYPGKKPGPGGMGDILAQFQHVMELMVNQLSMMCGGGLDPGFNRWGHPQMRALGVGDALTRIMDRFGERRPPGLHDLHRLLAGGKISMGEFGEAMDELGQVSALRRYQQEMSEQMAVININLAGANILNENSARELALVMGNSLIRELRAQRSLR
jgi:hypothetical protein